MTSVGPEGRSWLKKSCGMHNFQIMPNYQMILRRGVSTNFTTTIGMAYVIFVESPCHFLSDSRPCWAWITF